MSQTNKYFRREDVDGKVAEKIIALKIILFLSGRKEEDANYNYLIFGWALEEMLQGMN